MSNDKDTRQGNLHCPNCGAAASPGAVACPYCRAALAVLVCPSCFGALFEGMKHCPSCGTGTSGVRPAGDAAEKCPRCQSNLSPVDVAGHRLHECLQCGGLWVDQGAFERICAEREEQEALLGLPEPPESVSPSSPGSTRLYVPCPRCGKLMNRTNFAGCSGVIVDWCKAHGSWFDRGELRKIVVFLRSGGMRKAREKERQKLEDEKLQLRSREFRLATLARRGGEGSSVISLGVEDSASLLDLFSGFWHGLGN